MVALRAIHLLGLIAWFGTAAADVVLELTLRKAATRDARRALVRLHRSIDLILEGPAAVLVVASGAAMLHEAGCLLGPWPAWLAWKIGCGLLAALTNLICAGFVVARARAFDAAPEDEDPWRSPAVRLWDRAVLATGIGVPFAAVAFWIGVTRVESLQVIGR